MQTQMMAERAPEQAQDAYCDLLKILTEAKSFTLPQVDVEVLEQKSQDIKSEVCAHGWPK